MGSNRKSTPHYSWIPAPVGRWFFGPRGRKLAHVWPGAGGTWWGTQLGQEGFATESPLRFHSEDAALDHFRELLTPKPEAGS